MDKRNIFCKKCNRSMDESNFYSSKNIEKYPPDGKMDTCKKCMTMHVNSWEPTTFIHILQEVDVPYIESEWNNLLDRYGQNPLKVTGTTIIGRYLSKMKLKQFLNLTWADTAKVAEEAVLKAKLKEDQINAQQNRYAAALDFSMFDDPNVDIEQLTDAEMDAMFQQPEQKPEEVDTWKPYTPEPEEKIARPEDELTFEDRKYLTLKWGKLYRPEEWIALERFYEEMMESFDIQGAAHIDYLKMICKTSLKMNQAIDCGDIEGFQKLSKVYDNLMKSAKFTAAQNKADSGEFVDSVGELMFLAEEQGFIPRFHTDEPQDIVDVTLKDMKGYTYKLVTEEMSLGNMIEMALQQIMRDQNQEEGELDESDDFLNPELTDVLDDAAYQDFYATREEQEAQDRMITEGR